MNWIISKRALRLPKLIFGFSFVQRAKEAKSGSAGFIKFFFCLCKKIVLLRCVFLNLLALNRNSL